MFQTDDSLAHAPKLGIACSILVCFSLSWSLLFFCCTPVNDRSDGSRCSDNNRTTISSQYQTSSLTHRRRSDMQPLLYTGGQLFG